MIFAILIIIKTYCITDIWLTFDALIMNSEAYWSLQNSVVFLHAQDNKEYLYI